MNEKFLVRYKTPIDEERSMTVEADSIEDALRYAEFKLSIRSDNQWYEIISCTQIDEDYY